MSGAMIGQLANGLVYPRKVEGQQAYDWLDEAQPSLDRDGDFPKSSKHEFRGRDSADLLTKDRAQDTRQD